MSMLEKLEILCLLCNSRTLYGNLKNHFKTCPNSDMNALEIYAARGDKNFIEEHVKTCENVTYHCRKCRKSVIRNIRSIMTRMKYSVNGVRVG